MTSLRTYIKVLLTESDIALDSTAQAIMDAIRKTDAVNLRRRLQNSDLGRRLDWLGEGRTRIALLLDKEYVIKIAKDQQGREANRVEFELSASHIFPDVYWHSADFHFIICELVKGIDDWNEVDRWLDLTGVKDHVPIGGPDELTSLAKQIRQGLDSRLKRAIPGSSIEGLLKNDFFSEYLNSYVIDLVPKNLGFGKNGRPVILDFAELSSEE